MTRIGFFSLILAVVCMLGSGCAMRQRHSIKHPSAAHNRPKKETMAAHEKTPRPKGYGIPVTYAEVMRLVLHIGSIESIEDTLQIAYEALERDGGSERANEITGNDPVFHNEAALVYARKKELEQAEDHLEKAWTALQAEAPYVASNGFLSAGYQLTGRLYDSGMEMNARKDQAIIRAFRDFVFLKTRSERYFIDQVVRRDHRFLPEPAIFPGYYGSIPLEVVNDWYHQSGKSDLFTWRRFSHFPFYYAESHLRQARQAVASNLLIIGVLNGNPDTVKRALQRLEYSPTPENGTFRQDRTNRGLLMFGHYLLGQDDLAMRYEDAVLKNILVP